MYRENNQYNAVLKYILVGDQNVGKTAFMLQFVENRFIPIYDPTNGVELGIKYIYIRIWTILNYKYGTRLENNRNKMWRELIIKVQRFVIYYMIQHAVNRLITYQSGQMIYVVMEVMI
ncbi:Rab2a [Hexamita inflata]|uniref:Rab2a n=1 Tax=Hexamita inflata TaxID=28002 RepID=A0AA86R6S1_9EUKA|nr:Rab2a [Hexamita inflata]